MPLFNVNENYQNPTAEGYYGAFGGAYIPEMLYENVETLKVQYLQIMEEPEFKAEVAGLKIFRSFRLSFLNPMKSFAALILRRVFSSAAVPPEWPEANTWFPTWDCTEGRLPTGSAIFTGIRLMFNSWRSLLPPTRHPIHPWSI